MKWTRWIALFFALAGVACKSDVQPEKLRVLEQRVSSLEVAAGARPAPSASASAPADPVARLEQRIDAIEKDMARTLKTVRVPLDLDHSGNEACAAKGHICLSVVDSAGSARYDANNQFCGHMAADCSSRVQRRVRCGPGNDYVLAPVKLYRSPGTIAQCDALVTETCASSPSDITAICLE